MTPPRVYLQGNQMSVTLPNKPLSHMIYRLFGLTPVIFTDCEYPTRMQLHSGLEYSMFVNAALLLLLFLLLATDLRLWINTPVSCACTNLINVSDKLEY